MEITGRVCVCVFGRTRARLCARLFNALKWPRTDSSTIQSSRADSLNTGRRRLAANFCLGNKKRLKNAIMN